MRIIKITALALCLCFTLFSLFGCIVYAPNGATGDSENKTDDTDKDESQKNESVDTTGSNDDKKEDASDFSDDNERNEPLFFNVTFVYNNGEESLTEEYRSDMLLKPEDPKKEKYIFLGWCKNEGCTRYYDFDTELSADITLYASWTPDYSAILNETSRDAMKFNVKIVCDFYIRGTLSISSTQGSGAIFYLDDSGYYYALTNNHVVDTADITYKEIFKVYDLYGNEYEASLVANDKAYDLGVVKFKKNEKVELGVASLNTEARESGSPVISLGSPKGQFNNVSFGKLAKVGAVDMGNSSTDLSDVRFDVIWHTAYENHGSSGGALLNEYGDLIGINYAAAKDSDGSFSFGFAVSAAKVIEFLNLRGLLYNTVEIDSVIDDSQAVPDETVSENAA